MTTLTLNNLSKTFGADTALKNFSATFSSREFVVITGSNGAGKSTLLKCIAKIYEAEEGRIDHLPGRTSYAAPTSLGLYEHLTVKENLLFFSQLNGIPSLDATISYWGLNSYLDKKISALSLGQKMRVALARVFSQEASLIILDEPTVGLDAEGITLLCQQLSRSPSLIIIATHDTDAFTSLATRHIQLHLGTKVADASRPQDISPTSIETPTAKAPSSLSTLLIKDFSLEFSAKETLLALFNFSILLYVLFAVGIANAIVTTEFTQRIYPVIFWVLFLLIGLLSADRAYSYETKFGALTAIYLAKISPRIVFLSKLLSTTFLLMVAGAFQAIIGAVLLDAEIQEVGTLIILGSFATSSVAVLLSAISSTSKLPSLTLPLLALPTLAPLFLALQELSYDHAASPWASIIVGLNVIYFTLGLNLYEFATKE